MKYTFTGAFAPFICGLIEKKQALGHDYHGSACILRTFDKFCREQFPHETCLTAELAMKWAEQSKTEKNLSRLNRVSVVRELAKYMNSVGEQAYLLPLQLTKKTGRHNLIKFPQRGVCLYKCGNERYLLEVHAPAYKEKLFGTAGGR